MQCGQLPIPEIREDLIFQHSHKQAERNDSFRHRPPKLKPRYHLDSNFNRSHSSSSANFITFRSESSVLTDLSHSSVYNRSKDETYFEQCFTRISKIGEGSFGEVFKVRCKEDGLLYAVKMTKQMFRSKSYRQERLEEVKLYEQFSEHENCVRFYKAWEQDDRLYMQMELCQESLEQYASRRRQLPEEKIWSIILDLLLALKSLHDKNLIHLDIKLDNVLIGDDGSFKLADFGLVTDLERANRNLATEGDSRYIAPELLRGNFSKAADIFSLGIAILELYCCLKLPSNGPLWQQLRSGILPENFIKKKSTDLISIIKLMMTPQPHSRPTVDQLLNHKKMLSLLQRRRRWELLKKVKQSIRKSRRIAWSKLCNFRNRIFQYFVSFFTILIIPEADTNTMKAQKELEVNRTPSVLTRIISSTPTSNDHRIISCLGNDILKSDSNLNLTQNVTPLSFGDLKVVNSTPLTHSHQRMRSRKDLTKTSFKTVANASEQFLMDKTNSFLCLEDIETQSCSFVRNPRDSSSLRGKKLFSNSDDSD